MTARNRHPLDDLFHKGFDPDSSIVLASAIGPFSAGTSVHTVLATINNMAEATHAPSFKADADFFKTQLGTDAWQWVLRYDDAAHNGERFLTAGYGNGLWIAGATDGSHAIAGDPTGTWTRYTNSGFGGFAIQGVAYGNGVWVMVGSHNHVSTSTDPVNGTWTLRTSGFTSTSNILGVTFANNTWVIYGANDNSTAPVMATATDPTGTWTVNTSFETNVGGIVCYSVAYGNGIWVGVGSNNPATTNIGTATDPAGTWTLRTSPSGANLPYQVAYGAGKWAIAGTIFISSVSTASITSATDPTGTWTRQNVFSDGNFAGGMAFGNGNWYAIGAGRISGVFHELHALTQDPTGSWTTSTATSIVSPGNRSCMTTDGIGRWIITGNGWTSSDPAVEVAFDRPSQSFLANAMVRTPGTGAFLMDADITKTGIAGSFSADADLKKTPIRSLTADAVVYRPNGGFLTLDAEIV